MGIRFRCHHCEHELHLKEFQGGRRARCPDCGGKFRVPTASTEFSIPLEDAEAAMAGTASQLASRQSDSTSAFVLKPASHDPEASRIVSNQQVHRARTSDKHSSADPQTPAAIAEAPDSIWYVRPPNGGQYGPADAHIFFTWLQDQRVSADSLVWRDGWPQWMVAGEAFEDFFGSSWRLALTSEPLAATDPIEVTDPIANLDSAAPSSEPTVRTNPIQARRKKQQSTYGIFIAVLAIFAIALAVVLARVLLK